MSLIRVAAYWVLGLMLMPACQGCLSAVFQRPRPLPARSLERPIVQNSSARPRPPGVGANGAQAARLSGTSGVDRRTAKGTDPRLARAPLAIPTHSKNPAPLAVLRTAPPKTDVTEKPTGATSEVGPVLPAAFVEDLASPIAPPEPMAATHINKNSPPPIPIPSAAPAALPRVIDDPAAPPPIPRATRYPSPDGSREIIDDHVQLRNLHRQADEKYKTIDSYIARMRRREQVNGKDKPEELMLVKFRKKPWSIYFKWLGVQGHDREVVYVQGHHGNMLHTLLAADDVMLMPAGKRMALPPDSVLVRSASRHAITEAGIGVMIDHFGRILEHMEKGANKLGTMKYLGQLKRPEYDRPLEVAEQVIPANCEPQLSKGGSRLWFFDPANALPVVLITQDHLGNEVEYYCYDRLEYPVKLDHDDFNPDKLWKQADKATR